MLELGSRGAAYPAGPHPYLSVVADHAITWLSEPEDTRDEFATLMLNVLAPKGALLEKIVAGQRHHRRAPPSSPST